MIVNNPYITTCESSTFSVLFNTFNWRPNISLIHGLMQYPEWQPGINLFDYVENLDQLQNDPHTYFVFDASTEGFSPFENFFFDILYESCKLHDISPKKIIFVSTNMKDLINLDYYNQKNNITESIKVFPFLSFKKMMQDMIEDEYGFDFDKEQAFAYFYKECERQYSGTPGLSLSRVNREHRSLANFLLYNEKIDRYFKISQDRLSANEITHIKNFYRLGKDFDRWCNFLPQTIDTADFESNHALSLNSHLHNSTLFQIVNETHVKDSEGTSMFFSEKTFRSIAHMQPFLIFGQPGCNKTLESLGFRLFDDVFDYGFDEIQNTEKRYQAIIDTCSDLLNKLEKMNRQEQIDWRFSCSKVLKHNFSVLMDIDYFKKDFTRLIKTL